MTPIDVLISKHSWMLQCWDDNHGRGVWAVIGPVMLHMDTIREMLDGVDDVCIPMGFILGGVCSWLPTATAATPTEAMNALNRKLAKLPAEQLGRTTDWGTAVFRGFERLVELNEARYLLNSIERGNVIEPVLVAPAITA